MTEFVRRLVSGSKARFKDPDLDLELDLAYVTDQIIVMGYPSIGLEGLYRNRREDAQRFLTSRHGNNFWVFNFCPVRENSYGTNVFGGRVSRYPFPDHHAPPLAILPLVSREIHAWVADSKDRVAVLHCKAGKGRSGTLACAYLLSLDTFPSPSSTENSHLQEDWINVRVDDCMQVIPNDTTPEELGGGEGAMSPALSIVDELLLGSSEEDLRVTSKSSTPVLQQVLDWHTSRRMKGSSMSTKANSKGKQGVSIPSQRRWLLYWSRLLAAQGPPGMWGLSIAPSDSYLPSFRKVRITEISLRMRELSGIKTGLIRATGLLMDRGRDKRGFISPDNDRVWASLARYDDEMVSALEHWERHTRDSTRLERRKKTSEPVDNIFSSDNWDKEKMIRTFGQMRETRKLPLEQIGADENAKVYRYVLHPLSEERWTKIRKDRSREKEHGTSVVGSAITDSAMASTRRESQLNIQNGIIVDSDRELRIKLYAGQVIMAWMWLIPSFHMVPGTPSSSIILTREELDFPIGIGKDILDVEVKMEWYQLGDEFEVNYDGQVEITPPDAS